MLSTVAALLLMMQAPAEEDSFLPLDEISVLTGYARGNLKQDDEFLIVLPLALHIGFDLNPCVGLGEDGGHFQLALEIFANSIVNPQERMELGVDLFLKWREPLFEDLAGYIEVGTGPMYFGIDTVEQDHAGFNFLTQLGLGLLIYTEDDVAIQVGYRFRHISNAGLRDNRNVGVDSNSFVIGVTVFY